MGSNARYKDPKDLEKLNRRQVTNIRGLATSKYTTQIMNRVGAFALGELTNRAGEKEELSMAELKACEIILRKTCPDLSLVAHVDESANLSSKSREELTEMLTGMLSANPMLAKMSELQKAVDQSQTVVTIQRQQSTDREGKDDE